MKCKMRHPPGDEIYRDGNVSVFEVDGRKNKVRFLLPLSRSAHQRLTFHIYTSDLLSKPVPLIEDVP